MVFVTFAPLNGCILPRIPEVEVFCRTQLPCWRILSKRGFLFASERLWLVSAALFVDLLFPAVPPQGVLLLKSAHCVLCYLIRFPLPPRSFFFPSIIMTFVPFECYRSFFFSLQNFCSGISSSFSCFLMILVWKNSWFFFFFFCLVMKITNAPFCDIPSLPPASLGLKCPMPRSSSFNRYPLLLAVRFQ